MSELHRSYVPRAVFDALSDDDAASLPTYFYSSPAFEIFLGNRDK